MDPTPYVRLSTTHARTLPPAGFVDFYYDSGLSRIALIDAKGILHSAEAPDALPAQWGTIIGTLSAQTDLQTALDTKFNKLGGPITGDVSVSLTLQTYGLVVSDNATFAATAYSYSGGPGGGCATAHRAAMGVTNALAGKLDTTGGVIAGNLQVTGTADLGLVQTSEVDTAGLGVTGSIYHNGTVVLEPDTVIAWQTALGITPVGTGLRSHSTTDDTIGAQDRYVRATSNDDVEQRIPNDSVVDFAVGTKITFRQAGQGTISLVAGAGVELNGQLTTQGRHRSLGIIKVGPNEWDTERGAF